MNPFTTHDPKPKGPDHSKIRILFQPKNEANLPTQPPNIYRVYPVYNTVITVVASWEKFGFIFRYPHSWFRDFFTQKNVGETAIQPIQRIQTATSPQKEIYDDP